MANLNFININGDKLNPSGQPLSGREKKESPTEFHKGFRVKGVPPGALDLARAAHTQVDKPFDPDLWLIRAKLKAVRAKPYEVPEAAQLCKQMAEKEGWTRVTVVEISKGKA